MNAKIYDRLKAIARDRSSTTYADIAPPAGLDMSLHSDRGEMSRLLGEIAHHEQAVGHPMLTAVVIHRTDNLPGSGFFTIAQEFGRFDGTDRVRFWIDALKEVHEFWQNQ